MGFKAQRTGIAFAALSRMRLILLSFCILSWNVQADEKLEQCEPSQLDAITAIPKAAEDRWSGDLLQGLKRAKSENKMVLAYFTGSEACPSCKALDEAVKISDLPKEFSKSMVSVQLIHPKFYNNLSEELQNKNKALFNLKNSDAFKAYRIESVPAMFILSSDGKVYGKKEGYAGESREEYLASLKRLEDRGKKAYSLYHPKAPTTLDDVDQALTLWFANGVIDFHKAQLGLALKDDGEIGKKWKLIEGLSLRQEADGQSLIEVSRKMASKLNAGADKIDFSGELASIRTRLNDYEKLKLNFRISELRDQKDFLETHQRLKAAEGVLLKQEGKMNEAAKAFKDSVELDPKSMVGKNAASILNQMKTTK